MTKETVTIKNNKIELPEEIIKKINENEIIEMGIENDKLILALIPQSSQE